MSDCLLTNFWVPAEKMGGKWKPLKHVSLQKLAK